LEPPKRSKIISYLLDEGRIHLRLEICSRLPAPAQMAAGLKRKMRKSEFAEV
jgi:hypothetical protein